MEGCAMGQVLHGSARTTAAVRRAIQHSQESLRVLARRHGINPKTVSKWKKRGSVADRPTGPKQPRSTVLTLEEEAIIVAFRRHTLLPLDDCLYALQATIPHLTRSSLHRCLKRHGISRLPNTDGDKPRRAKFKHYPIGYFHIDLAEVRTEQGKLYLLVAIDRTSKFAFVELHDRVTRRVAGNFLRALIAAVPYKVHTVLTDNGTHFTEPSGNTWTPDEIKEMLARKQLFRAHAFELACAQNDVAHRLTKPRHPWTNGQVERMNRTIKEATVQRFYYATHDQLRTHLADFVAAYNFARRLKTLKGLPPYEFICKRWTIEPERFRLDPLHQMPGLNISALRARFDRIFTRRTGFVMLDRLLARLHRRKAELLRVLERSEIPLHTNASENDIRACVTKRKISGGTMSEAGRNARDMTLGLMKTCRKLGLSFYAYLGDRLGLNTTGSTIPQLAHLVSAPT